MDIFWFRRDLRLDDNAGLFAALNTRRKVLPIFIFDTNILAELPRDDARVTFISDLLQHINAELKLHGSSLAVFHGEPIAVIKGLIAKHKVENLYTNRDYEPYAIARDNAIAKAIQPAQFHAYKDHVIYEQDEVVKSDGTPYVVFTPYSKRWREKLADGFVKFTSRDLLSHVAAHDYPYLSLSEIGFERSKIKIEPENLEFEMIKTYDRNRNFPAIKGTSNLSPHLRFGSVSIRHAVTKAFDDNNPTFLNELIWREFFMQILWHFPKTVSNSFRPKYDDIKWRNNELEFQKWCNGLTGYPIVDAGMRQLNATGYMHNRVRMVVASFLCKHLLIDWRWGEAYFAMKLLDYEQASNVGNWQWAAGSGVDAAPYFRIFNPSEQVRKFDYDLKYIRKWVPELESLDYPHPIVDHKEARLRCLTVYKEAVQ